MATNREALLTWLARRDSAAERQYIWTHPHFADFPAPQRSLVRHAEIFSSTMHGASLLYNLALSQLRERDDWTASYDKDIATWASELDLAGLRAWSLDDFWTAIAHPAQTVSLATKRFVTEEAIPRTLIQCCHAVVRCEFALPAGTRRRSSSRRPSLPAAVADAINARGTRR